MQAKVVIAMQKKEMDNARQRDGWLKGHRLTLKIPGAGQGEWELISCGL